MGETVEGGEGSGWEGLSGGRRGQGLCIMVRSLL